MPNGLVRPLFLLAGVYDFLIGGVFLFWGRQLYDWATIPQPNHWSYIQFSAFLLMIFGVMFVMIARNPVKNHHLIPLGMLLKLSYSGLAGYYWMSTDIPTLFKPFAIIDAVMLALFFLAWTRRPASSN